MSGPYLQAAGRGRVPSCWLSNMAARRLRHAVPLCGEGSVTPLEPPAPRLLSDGQIKQFIVHGYLQLSLSELGEGFHAALYEHCCAWDPARHGVDGGEPPDTRHSFTDLPELAEVIGSPTMRGALTSLLGEGYLLHHIV